MFKYSRPVSFHLATVEGFILQRQLSQDQLESLFSRIVLAADSVFRSLFRVSQEAKGRKEQKTTGHCASLNRPRQ